MTVLQFWTDDARFGLRIPEEFVIRMLGWCADAGDRETGGVLIGHYTLARDCAEVTDIIGPPPDSAAGRTWFVRGIGGLQQRLRALWRERQGYYLGEWHLHPGGQPLPSTPDDEQMRGIARSKQYACPEPLLLLIGGTPETTWPIRVFVYPHNDTRTELKPLNSSSPCS